MNWYIAPVCTVDVETTGYHPGEGDGSTCPGLLPGMIIHAYDPVPDDDLIPTTCLVGTTTDESSRAGWTPQTLQAAKDHFEAIHGYAPSADEVS